MCIVCIVCVHCVHCGRDGVESKGGRGLKRKGIGREGMAKKAKEEGTGGGREGGGGPN